MIAALLLCGFPLAVAAQMPLKGQPGARVPAAPQPWPKNVTRFVSDGRDGANRYYLVTCRDQSRTSVHVVIGTDEVCAQKQGEKPLCKLGWLPLQAASYACPR